MMSPVSHMSRLITKEHIATHTNLILPLCTLVIKLFKILTATPVFLYKLCNLHGKPTFKIEALRLVSNVQLVNSLYNSSLAVTHDALCY